MIVAYKVTSILGANPGENELCGALQVIVVVDEEGNVIREQMKDVDVLAQYRTMRETLIYLCHLDYEDTENQASALNTLQRFECTQI